MSHKALRAAPRLARLLVLAVPLLAAACSIPTRRGASWEGGLGEGGADGFNTAELYTPHDEACLEAGMAPDGLHLATEGGADGFTDTGYASDLPPCIAGIASGWRAAGGWGVLRGWTPFPDPPAEEGGRPRDFSGLWGDSPVPSSSGPGLFPYAGFWRTSSPPGSPALRRLPGGDPDNPPDEDDPETLLVIDPDPRPTIPSVIAEPATLVLLGSALLVLGLLRRERDTDLDPDPGSNPGPR